MADANASADSILNILSQAGVDINALAPELLRTSGYGLSDQVLDPEQQGQLDKINADIAASQEIIKQAEYALIHGRQEKFWQDANKSRIAEEQAKIKTYEASRYPLTKKTLYKLSEEELMAGMSASERARYENEKLMLDRQNKALKGELPVSEALSQNLAEQKTQGQSALSRNLGTDWQNSTVGQKNLSLTQQREALIRDAASRDDLSTVTGLLGQQQGMINNQNMMSQQGISNYANRNMGLISGYQTAMQPGLAQMGYNAQMQMANMNANAQNQAGIYGLLGTLAGAGIAKYCWVAREVYGADNPKWIKFRSWVFSSSPSWFFKLYGKYGERFAKFIHNKPTLKWFIRKWMDTRIAEVNYAVS